MDYFSSNMSNSTTATNSDTKENSKKSKTLIERIEIMENILEKGTNHMYLNMIEELETHEKHNQEYKSKLDETNQKLEESNKKIEELERVVNEMKNEFGRKIEDIDYDIEHLYTHR
jgi:DNA repair exonuclease SbcCD ATPase subunit